MTDAIAAQPTGLGSGRRLGWIFWLTCIGALLGYVAYLSTMTLNHDTQWYLISTARWLDGATLYRDIIEINPPMSYLVTAPPLMLARVLPLSAATLFIAYVLLLSGGSLVGCRFVLHRYPDLSRTAQMGIIGAAALALFIYPLPQFGQREHMMLALILPYLLLAAVREANGQLPRGYAVAIGAAAGAGFALKPFFAVVPALLVLAAIVRTRRLSVVMAPEHLALLAVTIVYAALVPIAFPAYLTQVVPVARLAYAAGYTNEWAAVLLQPELMLSGVAALIVLLRLRGEGVAPLVRTMLVATVGFAISYAVQQKGWFYHRIPLGGCLILLAAALVADGRRTARTAERFVRTCLVGVIILGGTLKSSWNEGPYQSWFPAQIRAAVPGLDHNDRVYSFGQWLRPGVSLAADLGATWCSRYPALWPIPGAVIRRNEPSATAAIRKQADAVLQATRAAVVEDFKACIPTVVVIEPAPMTVAQKVPDFDYLGVLLQDPRFAALWRDYARVAELPSGHTIWRRTGQSANKP